MSRATTLQRRRRRMLGYNLKMARREQGLTQEQLALTAGLDRSFYVQVENGHHSLTVDRLWQIADALNCPAGELLEE